MCLHRKDFGSLLLVVVTSTIAWPQEIVEYGRECAVKLAPIPAFDCREGALVPITFNDRVPQSYPRHMTCDRPALLPYEATGRMDSASHTREPSCCGMMTAPKSLRPSARRRSVPLIPFPMMISTSSPTAW